VDEPASSLVPYLVMNGRITPPIDVTSCSMNVEPVTRTAARGEIDCSDVTRAVLTKLRFTAE
jgi:hypothetical protein